VGIEERSRSLSYSPCGRCLMILIEACLGRVNLSARLRCPAQVESYESTLGSFEVVANFDMVLIYEYAVVG
jgi:hypothetical protein